MILFEVIYFLILSLSVSYMWSFASIFAPVRAYIAKIPYIRKPMLCPDCSSFWLGLLVSFLYNPVVLSIEVLILTNVFCGLITHLFASFLYKLKLGMEISALPAKPAASIDFIN